MNLKQIKKLVEKWVKWSWEEQLKLFMKNKKTTSMFEKIVKWSTIK